MRRLTFALSLLASASTSLAAPAAAQEFEGVITVRMAGTSRDGTPLPELEYLARAGKMRVNVKSPMGSMGVIADPASKKMYMLMDAQRMYSEMPMAVDEAVRLNNAAAPTITRTGKKEVIAGRECEHVTITSTQGTTPATTDVCLTKGLGSFMSAGAMGGAASMPAWQRAMLAEGAFPLRVSRADGTTQLEVTKIEKKKLAADLFAVPDSYTKMDMPRRPPGAH